MAAVQEHAPTTIAEDEAMLEEGAELPEKGIDVEELRKLVAGQAASLGDTAEEVLSLKTRLAKVQKDKRQKVPKHVQLQRPEQKLAKGEAKLQKGEAAQTTAEKGVEAALTRLAEIKEANLALLQQQSKWEDEKRQVGASFQVQNGREMGGMEQDQAAAAAAAPAAQGEVTELQRAAQRITNFRAQAAIQSDAGDERAKALGQALEGGTQCLMLHLEN